MPSFMKACTNDSLSDRSSMHTNISTMQLAIKQYVTSRWQLNIKHLPVSIGVSGNVHQHILDLGVCQFVLIMKITNTSSCQFPLAQVDIVAEELEQAFKRNLILPPKRVSGCHDCFPTAFSILIFTTSSFSQHFSCVLKTSQLIHHFGQSHDLLIIPDVATY